MTLDTIVQVSPDQVSCDLGGEAAILNLKTGIYYGLDPVGAAIWKRIAQPRAVSEIRDSIVAEYDVTPEECEQDVVQLLETLAEAGLIGLQANVQSTSTRC